MAEQSKPLGTKAYGHIPHLPSSRTGPGDHHCSSGQANIATVKVRDKHDRVIVQEKLDGTCVSAVLLNDKLIPLTRSGYEAWSSSYEQHHLWGDWVVLNEERFRSVLCEGERLVGEWLAQAHGTRYELFHEPFVAFDIMTKSKRDVYEEFNGKLSWGEFVKPHIIHQGSSFGIDDAMKALGDRGFHGSLDKPEGAVWRVERFDHHHKMWNVDFLCKYVRHDKIDGAYLPEKEMSKKEMWNWRPA